MTTIQPKPAVSVLVAIDIAKVRNEVLIEIPGAARRRRMSILGAPQGLFARPRFPGQIMNTDHATGRNRAPGSFSAR